MFPTRIHIIFASFAILSAAVAAEAMTPRTLMAQSAASLVLEDLIPKQFGAWKAVPDIRVVEPPGGDNLAHEIYNQEVARGFADEDGHVVMLLVAYGVSQSDRLQLHRPEVCYAANGFRVTRPVRASLPLDHGGQIRLTRLVAQREGRFEPITYWMRIGNDIATGVIERQILKVKYGLRGLIPDGALIRVSTVGIPEDIAFAVQSRFIKDLLASADPAARKFLAGDPAKALNLGLEM